MKYLIAMVAVVAINTTASAQSKSVALQAKSEQTVAVLNNGGLVAITICLPHNQMESIEIYSDGNLHMVLKYPNDCGTVSGQKIVAKNLGESTVRVSYFLESVSLRPGS